MRSAVASGLITTILGCFPGSEMLRYTIIIGLGRAGMEMGMSQRSASLPCHCSVQKGGNTDIRFFHTNEHQKICRAKFWSAMQGIRKMGEEFC